MDRMVNLTMMLDFEGDMYLTESGQYLERPIDSPTELLKGQTRVALLRVGSTMFLHIKTANVLQ